MIHIHFQPNFGIYYIRPGWPVTAPICAVSTHWPVDFYRHRTVGMIVERRPSEPTHSAWRWSSGPPLVRETILQLMVSERFRLDEVWRDGAPLHIQTVPDANVKAFVCRNGRATNLGVVRWNRARAKAKTS